MSSSCPSAEVAAQADLLVSVLLSATINRSLPAVGADQASSAVVSVEPPPSSAATSKETLANWREIVAMLVSNRSLGDTEALQELGDSLVGQGWTSAGHCCYLLSAPTPPLDGLGSPVPPRIHLYGSSFNGGGAFDIDGVIITEIVEYALSLVPVLKGQEPYSGVAYLQAYKLVHALHLAEAGDNASAQRSVSNSSFRLEETAHLTHSYSLPYLSFRSGTARPSRRRSSRAGLRLLTTRCRS